MYRCRSIIFPKRKMARRRVYFTTPSCLSRLLPHARVLRTNPFPDPDGIPFYRGFMRGSVTNNTDWLIADMVGNILQFHKLHQQNNLKTSSFWSGDNYDHCHYILISLSVLFYSMAYNSDWRVSEMVSLFFFYTKYN